MARSTGRPIKDEIIASALELAQTVGVEAFSYADLAQRLGISSASVHHHFRYKHELVAELLRYYTADFASQVRMLPDTAGAEDRLLGYAVLFSRTIKRGRICLCGMSAAEWSSIGEVAQREVTRFLAEQREWLAETVTDGIQQGAFREDLDPVGQAEVLLAALEGTSLLTRARADTPTATTVMEQSLRLMLSTPVGRSEQAA